MGLLSDHERVLWSLFDGFVSGVGFFANGGRLSSSSACSSRHPTSFALADQLCRPEGSMIKDERVVTLNAKGAPLTATDHFMCYGPTRYNEEAQWLRCDADSFYYRKSYEGCCLDPFKTGEGNRPDERKQKICADALATYNPDDNTLDYKAGTRCGPQSLQDGEWGQRILSKCYANNLSYQNPTQTSEPCRGEYGTLITKRSETGEMDLHDFCPAGTAPMGVQGGKSLYASWHCKKINVTKKSEFCCRISGKEQCGIELINAKNISNGCNCLDNEKVFFDDEEANVEQPAKAIKNSIDDGERTAISESTAKSGIGEEDRKGSRTIKQSAR